MSLSARTRGGGTSLLLHVSPRPQISPNSTGRGGSPWSGVSAVLPLVLLMVACMPGCERSGKAMTPVICTMPKADLELVASDMRLESLVAPEMAQADADLSTVPAGVLPRGFRAVSAAPGRAYWAVVGEKEELHGTHQGLWMFDMNWALVGRMLGSPPAPTRQQYVHFAWDAEGHWLAVGLVNMGLDSEVFVSRPPPPTFKRLVYLPDASVSLAQWSRQELILLCGNTEHSNIVLAVDPNTALSRTVYAEDAEKGMISPTECKVSPDGTRMAFSRVPDAQTEQTNCGIWVLNLDAGECVELTREERSGYYHMFHAWEGSDSILFVRLTPERRLDLYRLHLHS